MQSVLVEQAVGLLFQSADLALILVGTFTVAYFIYNRKRLQPKSYQLLRHPPRLKSFPVIGSLPFLLDYKNLHRFFLDKLPTMGPVIGFTMMSQKNVILQTRETIVEAFAKAELSNRPYTFLEELNMPRKGLTTMQYTAEFKRYHQLTLAIMKQFGYGKFGGVMEARIHGEVSSLIAELKTYVGRPVDPTNFINVSVMNVIASILFGKRYDRHDQQAQAFLYHNSRLSLLIPRAMLVVQFPAYRYIPYVRDVMIELRSIFDWYDDIARQKITACEHDEEKTPCFIRSFIEAEGGQSYDVVQLSYSVRDLIVAGSETISASIRYCIIFLANHQDIQARLQAEVDNVVAQGRLPSLGDQLQLAYVEAFMLELMRIKTIAPLGILHETTEDTAIGGFYVPRKTTVISNLHAVHMDPSVWEDPETFNPERFLDPQGNIINRDKLIPFSVGKRSCLGEQLVRQEIFLFLTGMLQNFTVLPPEGCDHVDCDEILGLAVEPSAYEVRFVGRDFSHVSPDYME